MYAFCFGFYHFIVINILLVDVSHAVTQKKRTKQLRYKYDIQKIYCLFNYNVIEIN